MSAAFLMSAPQRAQWAERKSWVSTTVGWTNCVSRPACNVARQLLIRPSALPLGRPAPNMSFWQAPHLRAHHVPVQVARGYTALVTPNTA